MSLKSKKIFTLLSIGWSIAILFCTLWPFQSGGGSFINIPHLDKVVHFGLFFILSGLMYPALKPLDKIPVRVFAVAYPVLLGALTEYLQIDIPSRSGDWLDLLADIGGSIVGLLIVSRINFLSKDAI